MCLHLVTSTTSLLCSDQVEDNAEPYSLTTAKRIPIPLMDKVKVEFELMKRVNIIEEITKPTDW